MLQSISWNDYCLTMGIALVVYYGWWLVRYAASLNWMHARMNKPADNRLPTPYVQIEATINNDRTAPGPASELPPAATQQKDEEEDDSQADEGTLFLPAVAGDLMTKVSALLQGVSEEEKPYDEFAAVKALLITPPYNRLRGTAFQEKVAEEIVTLFRKRVEGPPVTAQELSEWWGAQQDETDAITIKNTQQ